MTKGHPAGVKGGFSESQKKRMVSLYKSGQTLVFICRSLALSTAQQKHVKNYLREQAVFVENDHARRD